jgi:flagellar biosynthetic protein FliR
MEFNGVIVNLLQAQLFLLALTRILAILIHVPVLGGRAIPDPVKIGLGLTFALVALPWQPPAEGAPALGMIEMLVGIARELLIGTIAGYAAVLTFGALQTTGQLIGLSSGFSAGQILNPALEESGTALDQVILMTVMLLFLILNGHHAFLVGIQRTFALLPVNGPLPDLRLEAIVAVTAGMVTAGIQMSMPVMGTLLLTDLTLGLLARVAPQVHVFFLGIPLKVGVALVVLSISMIGLAPVIEDLFGRLAPRMLNFLGA